MKKANEAIHLAIHMAHTKCSLPMPVDVEGKNGLTHFSYLGMNEVSMLTEKQIANMRKNVKQRWISWFLAIMSVIMLALVVARLYMVDTLCRRTGITWSQIWTIARSGADVNTIYIGAELKAQEMLFMAALNIMVAIMAVTIAFVTACQRKNNILLLEYVDKEKSTKGEKGS